MKRFELRLEQRLYDKLKKLAKAEGRSLQKQIIRILQKFFPKE